MADTFPDAVVLARSPSVRIESTAVPPFWANVPLAALAAEVFDCRPITVVVAVNVPEPAAIVRIPIPVDDALDPVLPWPTYTVVPVIEPAPNVRLPVEEPPAVLLAPRPSWMLLNVPVTVPALKSMAPDAPPLAFVSSRPA